MINLAPESQSEGLEIWNPIFDPHYSSYENVTVSKSIRILIKIR